MAVDILPFGNQALLINFEQTIAPEINQQVVVLQQTIETAAIKGFSHCIPAYCSLTLVYDPKQYSFTQWKTQILEWVDELPEQKAISGRQLNIPVCYEAAFAPDLDEVSRMTDMTTSEIVNLHTSTVFRVYMLGFLPGFAYLGKLPDALNCARKAKPRISVSARSVGLAGLQTGIYPSEGPGGWQLIGQTPIDVFRPQQADPFLFQAGDQVYFHAIPKVHYHQIRQAVEAGTFDNQQLYESIP